MDVFKLYDQFTTNWVRIRTQLASHLIALGLLWVVGFALPLPAVDFNALWQIATPTLPPVLQGVGVIALASLGTALALGIYVVAIAELGYFLDRVLAFFLPLGNSRPPPVSTSALLKFAATLDPGPSEPGDLGRRISELQATYSDQVQEELKSAGGDYASLSRDETTHYRNAALFLALWTFAPWLLDEGRIVTAVEAVYFRGIAVLALYFLVARARRGRALRFTRIWYDETLSRIVARDERYASRIAGAARNMGPYYRLVKAYEAEQRQRSGPSLAAYLRLRFNLPAPGELRPFGTRISDWRRFGWDETKSGAYDDPAWLSNFAKWRLALVLDRIRMIGRHLMHGLGVGPP